MTTGRGGESGSRIPKSQKKRQERMNGVKKRLRIRLFYDANQETGRQGGNKSKGRECALPYQYLVTIWHTFIVESWDDNINDKKRWTASGQPRPWASVLNLVEVVDDITDQTTSRKLKVNSHYEREFRGCEPDSVFEGRLESTTLS